MNMENIKKNKKQHVSNLCNLLQYASVQPLSVDVLVTSYVKYHPVMCVVQLGLQMHYCNFSPHLRPVKTAEMTRVANMAAFLAKSSHVRFTSCFCLFVVINEQRE